jgi:hypothetical protein
MLISGLSAVKHPTFSGQYRWLPLLDFERLTMAGSTEQHCLVDVGLSLGFVAFVAGSSEADGDSRLIVAAIEPRDNSHVRAACLRELLSDRTTHTARAACGPPGRGSPRLTPLISSHEMRCSRGYRV